MDKEIYRLHADMCKVFSSPTRLEVLNLLRNGELTVSELTRKTNLSQSNVSQHLTIMKSRGILVPKRKGVNIYYRLANPKIIKAFDIIREILSERLKQMRDLAGASEVIE
ncbi:MAG: metalloregulator ArsR/SmtB family transcription factor [Candidatus Micrarchaeota archaeon]